MKGISESIFGYLTIALVVLTLALFLYSQSELRGAEVSKSAHARVFDEEARLSTIALFNNKVDFVQKPYVETMIDAALQSRVFKSFIGPTLIIYNVSDHHKVFYGMSIGTLNNTEIIPPLFDYYIPGKWKLVLMIPNETIIQVEEDHDDNYPSIIKNITVVTYYNVTYGGLSGEPRYVYKQLIPVPEERIGKLILYIG